MLQKDVKPSKMYYILSGLILIVGIILFIFLLITGISSTIEKIDNQVVVPGSKTIVLNEKGKYNVFFEYKSTIDNKVYETSSISGLICTLKHNKTGELITLNNSSINSNYSVFGRSGRSIFEFMIDEPGEYEIEAWYETGEGEQAVLAIGKGFGESLIRTILLCIGVLFLSIGASLAIFIRTFVNRRKNKNISM